MPPILKSRRFWTITVAVIAVTGGIFGIAATHSPHDAMAADKTQAALELIPTDVTWVQPRSLAQGLPLTGTLQATRQAVVKAKSAYDVKTIAVREGDTVREGQLLAQLDTRELEARLAEKISERDSTRAQFELAEKNRNTNRALLDKKFISQNAFDSTDSTFKANQATLEASDAMVQQARIALKDATVVAPISGIVGKKYVQLGEKASIDSPLFTIVDLDSLEFQALVPAGEVGGLSPGMPATVTVDGLDGDVFSARLDRVSPATEAGTRSIVIFLTVPNAKHVLKSGMFANGVLKLAQSVPLPTLPLAAVQSEAGQPIVWTVEDNKITRHTVHLGRRDEGQGYVEIKDGVKAGTPVIATKFDSLKEGAAASLVAAPKAPAVSGPSAASAAKA